MQEISIKSVKDGMVLAEPLENAHGSLLLGKGAVLTEAFAARLAAKGIQTVCVEGELEKEDISELPVSQANEVQKATLKKLFEGKIVNDSMYMIYNALVRHKNLNG
jgi:molybdopterin biosynthesis enzyme